MNLDEIIKTHRIKCPHCGKVISEKETEYKFPVELKNIFENFLNKPSHHE